MTGVYIEWLKSKRTKSFSIVVVLIIVATLWNIATISATFSHPELKMVGALFNNQNTNLLMFPIAVCVFAARIVGNERSGQTFKLQLANGQRILTIFNHKFLFMFILLSLLSVVEVGAIYFFGQRAGISIPLSIVGLHLVGQFLSIISLICIYLTLAMIVEKQGLLLASGLLGGFLGIVASPKSEVFISLLNPLTAFGSLAPYKYQFLGDGVYTYKFDEQLFVKLGFYALYCLLLYGVAHFILRKRGN